MTTPQVIGIGAALARIGQIQAMLGAPLGPGAPAAPPPASASATSAAAPGAMPPGFSQMLSMSMGAGVHAAPAVAPGSPEAARMAARIDEWIARKNPDSPLKGYGAVFVREGLANGIDPRALAAIARAESGLGSDRGARSINNAFGWGPHKPFASWEENIATVAAGLRKGYIDEGLVTLAQIQQKYCPVGAANDPTGLNSNWLRNTTLLYAELGGDPDGSVATSAPAG